MTASTDFDRQLASWLEVDGPSDVRREVVDAAFATARGTSQRRGVRAWLVGPGAWPATRRRPVVKPLVAVLLLGLLLAAAVALVAGWRNGPRPLLGALTPTGSLQSPMFDPVTVMLADGRVALVGATLDQKLHMETWDPASGSFSVAPGLDDRRFSDGRRALGVTPLRDGSLLIVMQYAASQGGATEGGYALRYDPATGQAHETAGFGPGIDPSDPITGDYAFASWPSTVDADGRVAWTPVPPASGPTVTYDPATDRFAVGGVVDPGLATFPAVVEVLDAERELEASAIVHLDDGRYLLVGGSVDPHKPAALVDPATFEEQPLDWPLVQGATYAGVKLRDGRVLVVGPTSGLFDPATNQFRELETDGALTAALTMDDGSVVLDQQDAVPFGANPTFHVVVFDPATDTIRPLGGGPVPFERAAWVALPDGRILVVRLDVEPSPDAGRAWTLR